ncbi:hypothetical protein [Thalassococcus sp. BH17M4-6]|uniref:hypothetical protein n=1 Tax=Thalassococcus sp. BH17M4-6 TaxID=3413148 RepID=UPI003BF5E255
MAAAPVTPAFAQQAEEEDGFSLMEEGAKLLFRGLMQEMEPALDELQGLAEDIKPQLRDFVREMGPALRELMTEVQDWSVYHPPEMLPNGDIILRRKTPEELKQEPDRPEGEIEL